MTVLGTIRTIVMIFISRGGELPSQCLTLDLMETLDRVFQKGLVSLKRVLQEQKRKKVVEKLQIYEFGSVYFW